MPPNEGKVCKICRGKGWVGHRGTGRRPGDPNLRATRGGRGQVWIRVPCVCGSAAQTIGRIGSPPLSRAILAAFARAGSFESDSPREITTAPPEEDR